MRKIVFDIETQNTFQDVGTSDSTALDISIIGIYDYSRDAYESFLVDEFKNLWPVLETADQLIGFNSEHFDLPLLNKYYHGDLSKIKQLDILDKIYKTYGRRMTLNQLAQGTLNTEKSGHGLEAITWWKNGEIDKIRKYCLDDVRITKDIYEYALKNQKLLFKEGKDTKEIKIDTTDWEKSEDSGLTLSLPF